MNKQLEAYGSTLTAVTPVLGTSLKDVVILYRLRLEKMGGRGRGRGAGKSMSLNLEALGIGRGGDAIPTAHQQPPPLFPVRFLDFV